MSSRKAAAESDSLDHPQQNTVSEFESADIASALDSVPPDLHPAVNAVRKGFTDMVVGWGMGTRDVCYAQLHGDWGGGRQDLLDLIEELCVTELEKRSLQDSLNQTELPRMFKGTFNLFLEGLQEPAERAFKDLLAIGSSHEAKLSTGPVEWAQECASKMICGGRDAAQEWIREACGEWAEWGRWRAPRLLAMAYGTSPYDAVKLWELLDPESSWALVRAFADRYERRLREVIDQAAGEAHFELTTQSPDAPEGRRNRGNQQTTQNPMLSASDATELKEAKRRARKPLKLSAEKVKRRTTIRHLSSDLGLDGLDYCEMADREGLKFSLRSKHSQKPGAPKTYTEALNHPDRRWRQAIWSEKHRVTNRLSQ